MEEGGGGGGIVTGAAGDAAARETHLMMVTAPTTEAVGAAVGSFPLGRPTTPTTASGYLLCRSSSPFPSSSSILGRRAMVG